MSRDVEVGGLALLVEGRRKKLSGDTANRRAKSEAFTAESGISVLDINVSNRLYQNTTFIFLYYLFSRWFSSSIFGCWLLLLLFGYLYV